MAMQKLRLLTLRLEDPKHPLLGPTTKALNLFGLWQSESTFRTIAYNIAHFCGVIFACTQFKDTYTIRHDLGKVLNNVSITTVYVTTVLKSLSYIRNQKNWKVLITEISRAELKQLRKRDPIVTTQMETYKKYTRVITYLYWMLVFSTNMLMNITPLLKYGSSKTYRVKIRRGEEPLPQIICSWFPFDNTKMPGYMWGVCVQAILGGFVCGALAAYDMNAVAIMSYLKGQMAILKGKCRNIFDENVSRKTVVDNIKECHKLHTDLVKHYKMFNALFSPIMFFYVLVCSSTICCSVIQFNLNEVTKSQKLWIIQYSMALVFQLFLFCWHGNEMIIETEAVDRGVYESDWWKGDYRLRQLTLLLAAKLNAPLMLQAGPFITLSVPAFITIMKGSYSFYTLISQMKAD